jgi:hypothetical protein
LARTQEKSEEGMESKCGPEQDAAERSGEAEVAEVNGDEEIVCEQGPGGLGGGVIRARPTGETQGEQGQAGQTGDRDAAGIQTGAEE